VWVAASIAPEAAEFWETKPFIKWSDGEVEKLLTDSPWTGLVAVPLPNTGPVPSGDGGGRGGGGGEGFGPGPRRIRVTIAWRSALPLRQAVVRRQAGQGGKVTVEQEGFLSRDEGYYVVGLTGLPPQYTRPTGGSTLTAFLRREGRPAIPAQQASVDKSAGGFALLIGFPKTDAITLEDREVEFTARFEPFEIKKKFKLKDMVVGGRLEL
jgi:hypothetical protein